MERINDFIEEYDLDSVFFSDAINVIRSKSDLYRMVKTDVYHNIDGGFEMARAVLMFHSGEVKKLVEPIVKLPCPRWIEARGSDVSWPESVWSYLSKSLREARQFVSKLDMFSYSIDHRLCSIEIAKRSVLASPNFSQELNLYMGDLSKVTGVTSLGFFDIGGRFNKFPEPIVHLPYPEWIRPVCFDRGCVAELQPVWMTQSQAKEESNEIKRKLEVFCNFDFG